MDFKWTLMVLVVYNLSSVIKPVMVSTLTHA